MRVFKNIFWERLIPRLTNLMVPKKSKEYTLLFQRDFLPLPRCYEQKEMILSSLCQERRLKEKLFLTNN